MLMEDFFGDKSNLDELIHEEDEEGTFNDFSLYS